MDFGPYREQISAIDSEHKLLIVSIFLVMFACAHKFHQTQDSWYMRWIPLFGITLTGLIMRLEVMVHRLGGFLQAAGDPWENFLSLHPELRWPMAPADALILLPAVVLVIYAEVIIWQSFRYHALQRWGYLIGTSGLMLAGIYGSIMAATLVANP